MQTLLKFKTSRKHHILNNFMHFVTTTLSCSTCLLVNLMGKQIGLHQTGRSPLCSVVKIFFEIAATYMQLTWLLVWMQHHLMFSTNHQIVFTPNIRMQGAGLFILIGLLNSVLKHFTNRWHGARSMQKAPYAITPQMIGKAQTRCFADQVIRILFLSTVFVTLTSQLFKLL